MAKRSRFRFAGGGGARPIVVRSSAPRTSIIKVSAPRPLSGRARRIVSKFGSAAASVARDEKHRLYACGAAALLGYAEKSGWDLPHVDMLGVPATYGLGGWFAIKMGWIRNKSFSHAVTGLLAVSAYKFGSGDTVLKLK